jgi:predicted AAA+ superfamily ATPase
MIAREKRLAEVRTALRRSRVTILVGPRQAGKTTLARQIVPTTKRELLRS